MLNSGNGQFFFFGDRVLHTCLTADFHGKKIERAIISERAWVTTNQIGKKKKNPKNTKAFSYQAAPTSSTANLTEAVHFFFSLER